MVSWPSHHEVKLEGLGAGGRIFVWLRQEGKLTLQHEVKLWGGVEQNWLLKIPIRIQSPSLRTVLILTTGQLPPALFTTSQLPSESFQTTHVPCH